MYTRDWTFLVQVCEVSSKEQTFDFECVDAFLYSAETAQALQFALSTGLVDRLETSAVNLGDAAKLLALPTKGADLLLSFLTSANVVAQVDHQYTLSKHFKHALAYRDLLEAKLFLGSLASKDLTRHFRAWLNGQLPEQEESEIYSLFRYDLCKDITISNVQATQAWVGVTTALTRYEAMALIDTVDLGHSERLLDIGGNSGEFARRLCENGIAETATVADLPVVCEIGKMHLANTNQKNQVNFLPFDMRADAVPSGFGLISFKSVLHDWPDDHASSVLEKVAASLPIGGKMLIFERESLPSDATMPLGFENAFNRVFAPNYRSFDFYRTLVSNAGLTTQSDLQIWIDWPFRLLVAERQH